MWAQRKLRKRLSRSRVGAWLQGAPMWGQLTEWLIPKRGRVRALAVSKQDVELASNESSWTEVGDNWQLSGDGWRVLVDPTAGARIAGFFVGNTNLLTGPEVDPSNYGSTFWTSPQSDWNWPPPPEVDNQPYAVLEGEDDVLVCCGAPCTQLGLLVTKRF